MGKLFGTDGIRGVANEYPMTPEIAFRVGRACGFLFKNKDKKHKIPAKNPFSLILRPCTR